MAENLILSAGSWRQRLDMEIWYSLGVGEVLDGITKDISGRISEIEYIVEDMMEINRCMSMRCQRESKQAEHGRLHLPYSCTSPHPCPFMANIESKPSTHPGSATRIASTTGAPYNKPAAQNHLFGVPRSPLSLGAQVSFVE
jgi:hypothetical protein